MSLRIDRLGHLGEGIAEGPVYVTRALPGELVDGEVEDGRIARPRILEPSPDRISAPCVHYKGCGGCGLMHASDTLVAEFKRGVVARALAAHALTAEVRGPETSPPGTRRRAVLSGRRLKSGALVGFHGRGSETLVPVPGCLVLAPDLLAAIPACEEITAMLGSRKGEMRFTATASGAGVDLRFEGGREIMGPDRIALAALAERHDLARLSNGGDPVVTRRSPVQRFGPAGVVPPPGAFLQATPDGERALVTRVQEGLSRARRVADLFAGCGTFALSLAADAEVLAVEGDAAMLAALDRGWRGAKGLKAVRTETRDLFRRPLLPEDLSAFDGVVIDPPRAGAEAQARALAASDVTTIAAVSCNPVTFARDARILTDGGYVLGPVTVIDQFRWSPHVELVATLTRGHIPG